jgi:hypothetical protein
MGRDAGHSIAACKALERRKYFNPEEDLGLDNC